MQKDIKNIYASQDTGGFRIKNPKSENESWKFALWEACTHGRHYYFIYIVFADIKPPNFFRRWIIATITSGKWEKPKNQKIKKLKTVYFAFF